jgi:hypothetical protein
VRRALRRRHPGCSTRWTSQQGAGHLRVGWYRHSEPDPGIPAQFAIGLRQASMLRHQSMLEVAMPEKATIERSRKAKRAGRASSTQAGPFVREEMHHVREGKHGARSTKQAIAIGLSKARRAGVQLPPPPATARSSTKRSAEYASRPSRRGTRPSPRRSRAISGALKREGRGAASRQALSRQAKSAARRRSASARRAAARKAVRTKGPGLRREAARRAARTRKARRRRAATS